MKIIALNISLINKFLIRFKPVFSKKMFTTFSYIFYALFKTYKRCSYQTIAENLAEPMNYEKVQYCASDASWSIDTINDIRLDILCSQRSTAPHKDSLLAIDDTSCPKPHAKHTEGAYWQYCGTLGREEVCNVAVFSSVVSKNKAFPVSFKSYLPARHYISKEDPTGENHPDFKSKLTLAKELMREAKASPHLSFISQYNFDSWYASSDILETIHTDLNGTFFSELKLGRTLHFHHPVNKKTGFFKIEELVSVFRTHYRAKFQAIRITDKDGNERRFWTYSFNAMLKDCSVPIKVVVVFGSWCKDDPAKFHAIFSNDKKLSALTIVTKYLIRWGIERVFQDLKDVCYFDHYQVRHKHSIERWWTLSTLFYSFLFRVIQNAFLAKIVHPDCRPSTLNACKKIFENMIDLSSAAILNNNPLSVKKLYNIVSLNFLSNLNKQKVA